MERMTHIERLVTRFTPTHYTLSLRLDRPKRKFDGTVTVIGRQLTTDTTAKLHAKDLQIDSVTIDGKQAEFTHQDDELSIRHADLQLGTHVITVSFAGEITDPMHGIYPCYYQHDGTAKELLATQFESHHAREAFPCIDEPEAKATFDLTLTTEKEVTVLSNMPIKNQRQENDLLVTQFDQTPRMSTYLLAWVVGELHSQTTKTKQGTDVSIWATPAQSSASLAFALDIARRSIEFFNDYFGTPYPLPKSDHVALPDFSAGAMENWGLITYREVALLAEPSTTALESKRQIALVIAHELSHQWFGNLVTMKWWNDLWLNESFANMMEYVAIDALEPGWEVWLDHASSEVIQALRRDSFVGVQAIQTDVHHPDEISTLFDPAIVYAKGGRLLHMLQSYIGTQAMQLGLQNYFQKHAYGNTTANDLWDSLGEAAAEDVKSLMDSWISQSGYPVVTVTIEPDNQTLTLRQEQFFIGDHQPSAKIWRIPLASQNPEVPRLMQEPMIAVRRPTSPLLLNLGSASHYITDYSPELRAEVLANIASLAAIDRLKVLNEQTLLAQAGRIQSADLINLLDSYRKETNEAVWGVMSLVINDLKKFVEPDTVAEQKLRQFTRALASSQYKRLGWEPLPDESEADTKLRSLIVSLMLYGEDDDARQQATERYHKQTLAELDPNLRTAILAHAVRDAITPTIIDDLLAQHQTTSSSELQEDIAAALTSTKDPAVVTRLLRLIQDNSVVRPQDVMRWFVWLLRNRYAREATWQWVRDNWAWIEKLFSGDKSYDAYPRYIAAILTTRQQLAEYKAFFTPMIDQPALTRNIEVGMVELQHRVSLIESEASAVRQRLLDLKI